MPISYGPLHAQATVMLLFAQTGNRQDLLEYQGHRLPRIGNGAVTDDASDTVAQIAAHCETISEGRWTCRQTTVPFEVIPHAFTLNIVLCPASTPADPVTTAAKDMLFFILLADGKLIPTRPAKN